MTNRFYTRKECVYADLKGVHITQLKEMRKSPKHYRHRLKHPRKITNALAFGTAAHTAVLEPERFVTDFAIWKSKHEHGGARPRNGNEWKAYQAVNANRSIILDTEFDEACSFKDAVRQDALAMKYLAMGRPEIAMAWKDEETGVDCVGRLDWETKVDRHPAVVDLKSARESGELWFTRDAAKLDYHLQLAFYADGYKAITGKMPRIVVIAVESAEPYDAVTYIAPEEVLEIGRDAYRELLVKLKACAEADEWPGQGGTEEKILSLPPWCVPDEEADDLSDLEWEKSA